MLQFVIRRAIAVVPLVLVTVAITFVLFAFVPRDPARQVAGETASPEAISAARERLGLHRPLYEQFLSYIGNLARGDLGTSYFSTQSVVDAIAPRMGVTVSLSIITLAFTVIVGTAAGLLAGVKQQTVIDRAVTAWAAIGIATPSFWLGIVLVSWFSIHWRLLPVGGYVAPSQSWSQWLSHLLLPALALGLAGAAEVARQTRAAVVEASSAPYERTAESKGLPRHRVVRKYILRFAWVPVFTVIGLQIARVLSGVVVIEAVFNLPGVGQLLVQSVQRGDLPIVQGIVVLTATIVLLTSLFVDLGYAIVDPRVRVSR